ncbi:PAS domain S-box-containing protein/diguanylate cyclase (GGDEF) domain-containing protein [Allopseudospirillum japonicum]|uniref:PAS domain S-box-containing protein/diguanylate cyclase (GGDEF) domain-containing protein n=1 Tax=Allopseudospirillum japonicum TaxID=64971 RepID=A0A1H6TNG1_9GAMM|nr:EAL domain-containing protein [Allopseudospirillum japonicum]SEI77780.1 PAS domain S-box-containing protein/diguanylate cyclase (GGDEF) domain-containing protein [Allopseudospirillum japonicum]
MDQAPSSQLGQDVLSARMPSCACPPEPCDYAHLFEQIPEALAFQQLVFDANNQPCDYRFVHLNPAFARLLASSSERICQQTATQVYQVQQAPFLKAYAQVVQTQTPKQFEAWYAPQQKKLRISVLPWHQQGFITLMTDLGASPQPQAQTAYIERLVQQSPAFMYAFDTEGRLLFANPPLLDLLSTNKQPKDWLGCSREHFLEYTQAAQHWRNDLQVLALKRPLVFEEYFSTANAQTGKTFLSIKYPLFDNKGQVTGIAGISTDISERKAMETALAREVFRNKTLINTSRDGIVILDLEGKVVEANPSFAYMLGYSLAELSQMNAADWQYGADQSQVRAFIEGLRRNSRTFESQHKRKDGSTYAVEISANSVHWEGETLVYCICRDISERQEADERLRLAASVFTHAHEGILITDHQNRVIDVNPTFCEITGYSRNEILGRDPSFLKSGHQNPLFYRHMWQTLHEEGFWRGEIWNRRKNGEVYAELLTISVVYGSDQSINHYVGIFSDITQLKQHQQHLEQLAHYDALTDLPNRVLLADRLQRALAQTRRTQTQMAVCYMDLDGFKPVNDTYGHEAGDYLLVEVARRLKNHMRGSDTVARLGGDEFVLLLCDLEHLHDCEQALERLLAIISQPYLLHNGELAYVTASIGLTIFPDDDADADTLLRHADQAMYQAKQAGRNGYHLFDPEQDRKVHAHQEALNRIAQAIENYEFCLYYQPKVNMREGRVIGAEALVRWQDPQRGLVSPGEFLPLIEEHPLSVSLGEWILEEAIRQLHIWRQQGLQLTISINIAGRHLQQRGFCEHLARLLKCYPDVCPQQVELEIVETSALADIQYVSDVIDQCRKLGVTFALDDFGTGYSSLTYLKRLPADVLKIDQSFVRDMLKDPEDMAIIEGVIGLSRTFGRQVIAEGVESMEHGQHLIRLGCELGQGYGIAKPMPAQELPTWIANYAPEQGWLQPLNS